MNERRRDENNIEDAIRIVYGNDLLRIILFVVAWNELFEMKINKRALKLNSKGESKDQNRRQFRRRSNCLTVYGS